MIYALHGLVADAVMLAQAAVDGRLATRPDANTPHRAVTPAMDAAGKLGFSRLRITTVEAGAEP